MAQPATVDPVLAALERAPVDLEPLPPELEAEVDERLAEVRSGTPTIPHADVIAP
jgi:hypothetical protein